MKTKLFRRNILPLLGRGLGGGFLLLWGLGGGCVLFAQDLSVCAGKGYTLTSTADAPATGATPVTYQWYEDGHPLDGKNEASLSIPGTKAAGDYAYVRMAANAECPEGRSSNTFTVRVHALPTVTASAAASACANATVVFTAAADGGTTAAMTYTWTIAGATASTTTTTYRRTLSTTGSNTYSVTVRNSNGCVSAASPARIITINGPAGANESSTCGCNNGLTDCIGTCQASCGMTAWTTCGFTAVSNGKEVGLKVYSWFEVTSVCSNLGMVVPTKSQLECMCAHQNSVPDGMSPGIYWSSTPSGSSEYYGVQFNGTLCEAVGRANGHTTHGMLRCIK